MKTEMKYLLNKDGKGVGYEHRDGMFVYYYKTLPFFFHSDKELAQARIRGDVSCFAEGRPIRHDSWLPVIELNGEWYRDGEEVELFCGTRGKLKYQALWYGWDVYLPTCPQPLSDFYDIASGKWRIRKVKP